MFGAPCVPTLNENRASLELVKVAIDIDEVMFVHNSSVQDLLASSCAHISFSMCRTRSAVNLLSPIFMTNRINRCQEGVYVSASHRADYI